MPNHPTPTGNGLWRLLVIDRDPADPKLILATVAAPGDVEPASPSAPGEALAWVRSQLGRPHAILVPMPGAGVWRVDEQPA
jgi:hypothetical protein